MSVDADLRITKFEEKPPQPESNLASMGLYIFNWPVLREALLREHANPDSHQDFGKDIIPSMLAEGKRLFAFTFSGYWKDVGTLDSYYTAHMELLEPNPEFDIFSTDMRIYSNANIEPPHYIGPYGVIDNSLICNGCRILGTVKHSVLAPQAYVAEDAVVEDSVLLPGARIETGAHVSHAIVGERSVITADCCLGGADEQLAVIGDDAVVTKEVSK